MLVFKRYIAVHVLVLCAAIGVMNDDDDDDYLRTDRPSCSTAS